MNLEELNALLAPKTPAEQLRMTRKHETRAGYLVVAPGEVAWLSLEDWHPRTVVSIDGRHVRLVELWARQPGRGAFRRLIAGIFAHGLSPDVIDPTVELQATLTRWGWERYEMGFGCDPDREDIWRPPGRQQGECERCG
jgi:hypothetical protein